jgi:hypothetical protein
MRNDWKFSRLQIVTVVERKVFDVHLIYTGMKKNQLKITVLYVNSYSISI